MRGIRDWGLPLWGLACFLCSPSMAAGAEDVQCNPGCNLLHGRCESSECRCDPGWEGELCERCVRSPGCVHGTCHQPWQCICQTDWAGRFCDKDIHACTHQQPCQNGGSCFDTGEGEHWCSCPDGFYGKNCELRAGPCTKSRSPCKNGGTCLDRDGFADTLTCRCLAGFVGPRCEEDVDDCLMRPCANGATCRDGVNRFSCICPQGFEGRFCTVNWDDCTSGPCQNGGRCYDRVADFDCVCLKGYSGKTCSLPVPQWRKERPALSRRDPGITIPQPDHATRQGLAALPAASPTQPVREQERLLKVEVKELLSEPSSALAHSQIVGLSVFGALTALLVSVTVVVMLLCRRQEEPSRKPPRSGERGQAEGAISFLQPPAPESRKELYLDLM
eukprot:gi/632960839/ref/XP_007896426.1/ PREDICTED: protein delta homolog 2 [Callorhinchus milii]